MASARRHGVTAAITALFAMALAAGVAGRGCNSKTDGPTDAVRAFLAASSAGDRDKLLTLLSPASAARLQDAAQRATKLVGGERRYDARDMLQPIASSGLVKVVNMGRDGDKATLSITDGRGSKSTVSTVLVDGVWLIDLSGE